MAEPATILITAIANELGVAGAKGAAKGAVEGFKEANVQLQESFVQCLYACLKTMPRSDRHGWDTGQVVKALKKSGKLDLREDQTKLLELVSRTDIDFLSRAVGISAMAAYPAVVILFPYRIMKGAVKGTWNGVKKWWKS